ncbi:hypothetical protein VNO80_20779 [Phaseolus coccineus]|uniref:RRM domain-containing protein n=1 Tax=Phaseolus coccineus TaxID=3886 RepID=A0AAN9QSM8_PHACN
MMPQDSNEIEALNQPLKQSELEMESLRKELTQKDLEISALHKMLKTKLDKWTPLVGRRWVGLLVVALIYALRVFLVEGFCLVSYGLGICILNLLIGFLSPPLLTKSFAPLFSASPSSSSTMQLVLAKIKHGVDREFPISLAQEHVPECDTAKFFLHKIPTTVNTETLHNIVPEEFRTELQHSNNGQGRHYSALAVFKSPQEANEAYKNVQGSQLKDTYGCTQKLVTFRLSTGMSATLFVRKMSGVAALPCFYVALPVRLGVETGAAAFAELGVEKGAAALLRLGEGVVNFNGDTRLNLFDNIMRHHANQYMLERLKDKSHESPEQTLVQITLQHPLYPLDYSFPLNDEGWMIINVKNKPKAMKSTIMLAVDGEMVLCEDGTEAVVKVCVVDHNLEAKLNEFVKPDKKIVDYRTEITGVFSKDLEAVTCSLADIQAVLGCSVRKKLLLIIAVLGCGVREKGAPHNCLDDACAAMQLVLAKIKHGVDREFPISLAQEHVPEFDTAKLFLHKIPTTVNTETLHNIVPEEFRTELQHSKNGQGRHYSGLAVFKNPQEADEAYKNVQGSQLKDTYGRPQKLVTFRLSTGMSATLFVRKCFHAALAVLLGVETGAAALPRLGEGVVIIVENEILFLVEDIRHSFCCKCFVRLHFLGMTFMFFENEKKGLVFCSSFHAALTVRCGVETGAAALLMLGEGVTLLMPIKARADMLVYPKEIVIICQVTMRIGVETGGVALPRLGEWVDIRHSFYCKCFVRLHFLGMTFVFLENEKKRLSFCSSFHAALTVWLGVETGAAALPRLGEGVDFDMEMLFLLIVNSIMMEREHQLKAQAFQMAEIFRKLEKVAQSLVWTRGCRFPLEPIVWTFGVNASGS